MPLRYRRQPCEHCAFRAGSPERADADGWNNLMLTCCHKVFHCHKTMFRTAGEEWNGQYDANRKPDGSPATLSDHQACAGFAKEFGEEFGINTAEIAAP